MMLVPAWGLCYHDKKTGGKTMGKKIINLLLFIVVVAAAAGMTAYVGQGATGMLIYNFVFLGIMVLIYLSGLFGGMFRMNNLSEAFCHATDELASLFQTPGKKDTKSLSYLEKIFLHQYLDKKMNEFTSCMGEAKEGIGDIEDYINEDELGLYIHKRILEMIPDILTSLGILGTFVGLVWGLKNFSPNDYEAMTSSVASLVEGIKVAFLTSIYGISLSIVYTYGMKSEYSNMTEKMQAFLDRFHGYVLPTAENESRNLLVASQKVQTQAMRQMAEQFSERMVSSFEQVITPTFQKMNDSLDLLVVSVTRYQRDAVKEILDVFLKEMNDSFRLQFQDFNEALEQLTRVQKENAQYTSTLYESMGNQLAQSYEQQTRALQSATAKLVEMQNRSMDTAARVAQDNQAIQKMQQQEYKNVINYMKEAEQSAAKFWVACNQTMQKYVEIAAKGMEKATASNQLSAEVLRANRGIIESFDTKMRQFTESQQLTASTMEQVRRLLSDIVAVEKEPQVSLMGSLQAKDRDTLKRIEAVLEEQSQYQQELLRDMTKNIRDLTKTAQKGKTGLFR